MKTSRSLLKAKLYSNKYKHLRRRKWLAEMSTHTGINIPEISEELKCFWNLNSLMYQECLHNVSEQEPNITQMRVRSGPTPVMDERWLPRSLGSRVRTPAGAHILKKYSIVFKKAVLS